MAGDWAMPKCMAPSSVQQKCLAVNDIDDTRTKARLPRINGIWERFHKTKLNEFCQVAFREIRLQLNRGAAGRS
jgi:hypothetical protein